MRLTQAQIDFGTHRYATEAARIATQAFWDSAVTTYQNLRKCGPREWAAFQADLRKETEAFRERHYNMCADAYSTGAIEALKMLEGDFKPEPWTNDPKPRTLDLSWSPPQ